MKTKLLLSSLLIAGIMGTMLNATSEAALSASQKICGDLGICKSVTNETPVMPEATITCADGFLAAPLVTLFDAKVNDAGAQSLSFTATAVASDSVTPVNAFYSDGTTMFIALANETTVPTSAQIGNAAGAGPSVANNPNVIAYPFTLGATITDGTGSVSIASLSSGDTSFSSTLTNQGTARYTGTATSGSVRGGTYSDTLDSDGQYCATVTLSFI